MQVDMPGLGKGGRKNILKSSAAQDLRGFMVQQVGLIELGYMPCRWTRRVEGGTRGLGRGSSSTASRLLWRGLALHRALPGSLLSKGKVMPRWLHLYQFFLVCS